MDKDSQYQKSIIIIINPTNPMDSSSQQPIVQTDFQNANAIIDSIAGPRDSQPTKLRVKNFKNRVFTLLKIYTNESPNVNPLIQCLKQEMFFTEPQKMQEILHLIMNKQNVTIQNLKQLAEYFKVVLLYKTQQKTNESIALEFVRLAKKLTGMDQEVAHGYLLDMLRAFAYERKCRLNVNFFFYFFRKYEHPHEIKKIFIEKLQEFLLDDKLRSAQKKQLTKILHRLDKSTRVKNNHVKKQQQHQTQNQDDDVKTTNKKNTNFAKVKKHQDDVIIQQKNEQNEGNQVSKEQQQKLQRIKANKKKNRKGNQGQKLQSQNPKQQTQNPKSYQNKKTSSNSRPAQNQQTSIKNQDKKPFDRKNSQSKSQSKGQMNGSDSKRQFNQQQKSKGKPHRNGKFDKKHTRSE